VKTLVGVAEAGIVLSWGERAQRVVLDDHEGGTAARMSPVNPRLWRAAERGHSAAWGKLARYAPPAAPCLGGLGVLGAKRRRRCGDDGRPHHDARRHIAGTDHPGPLDGAGAASVRPGAGAMRLFSIR
jgi:hypothetical protein